MENLEYILKDAEKRAEGTGSTMENADLKRLYDLARKIAPGNALDLVRKAESDEERNFFAFIADMNLQREQKKAIERNLF